VSFELRQRPEQYGWLVSGSERYIEQYQARMAAQGVASRAPPGRPRLLALTAAFTPMIAAAALPVTAAIAVLAWLVSQVTARWVGLVLLAAAVIAMGSLTARWATKTTATPAAHGWRRWLPLVVTIAVAATCLAEIVSGSHTPDPIILLWIEAIVWVAAFFPLAGITWGPTHRALWVVGPALTFATIVFVFTQGLFWLRFSRAVPDLDAVAASVAKGEQVPDGAHAGGFVVHDVNVGRLGRNAGCDVEFWITGWHQQDTRYIVHCDEAPRGNFAHLAESWWQLEDKSPPSNL
jgi:hypothetical protein